MKLLLLFMLFPAILFSQTVNREELWDKEATRQVLKSAPEIYGIRITADKTEVFGDTMQVIIKLWHELELQRRMYDTLKMELINHSIDDQLFIDRIKKSLR